MADLWQDSCIYFERLFAVKIIQGGDMGTEKALHEMIPAETANAELIRCGSCHRELRSPLEWICGDQQIICDVCYQNLLIPNKKISFEP